MRSRLCSCKTLARPEATYVHTCIRRMHVALFYMGGICTFNTFRVNFVRDCCYSFPGLARNRGANRFCNRERRFWVLANRSRARVKIRLFYQEQSNLKMGSKRLKLLKAFPCYAFQLCIQYSEVPVQTRSDNIQMAERPLTNMNK